MMENNGKKNKQKIDNNRLPTVCFFFFFRLQFASIISHDISKQEHRTCTHHDIHTM